MTEKPEKPEDEVFLEYQTDSATMAYGMSWMRPMEMGYAIRFQGVYGKYSAEWKDVCITMRMAVAPLSASNYHWQYARVVPILMDGPYDVVRYKGPRRNVFPVEPIDRVYSFSKPVFPEVWNQFCSVANFVEDEEKVRWQWMVGCPKQKILNKTPMVLDGASIRTGVTSRVSETERFRENVYSLDCFGRERLSGFRKKE